MTVEQNALRELASFDQVTTRNSNYFNDHSLVTQKCLKRYIFQAETSESKVRDTEENNAVVMQLRLDKRRLQYIESGVRIGQKWHGSGGLEERVAATLRLWEALVSFCACEPKVTIKCEYLWSMHLEVQVSRLDAIPDLVHELCEQTLRDRFYSRRDSVEALQREHITMYIVNILSSTVIDFEKATKFLMSMKSLHMCMKSTALVTELQDCARLVDPVIRSASASVIAETNAVLRRVEARQATNTLVDEFRKHRRLGSQ